MAGQRENQELSFVRCMYCPTSVVAMLPPGMRLEHNPDGTHQIVDAYPAPRPEHRDLSIWTDVRATLEHLRTVQFYLGYLPEKPSTGWVANDESVRMQLDDAVARLESLADAIAGA